MTIGDPHGLFQLHRQLGAAVREPINESDWGSVLNRTSMQSLQDLVHEAWMPGLRGVVARFHGGEVIGHTAPAYQVLRTSTELNEAVIVISNHLSKTPVATITDAVRYRLGLQMRPVAPGSVEMDFVVPLSHTTLDLQPAGESAGQETLEVDLPPSSTELALTTLLALLASVSTTNDHASLSALHADLGPRGWQKLAKLSNRIIEADFSMELLDRRDRSASFDFTPAHAAALKSFITDRRLDVTVASYEGTWQTGSRARTVFDLETDTGRVSGRVPGELIDASVRALDQTVRITVEETTADDEDDARVKRVLLTIVVVEDEPAD